MCGARRLCILRWPRGSLHRSPRVIPWNSAQWTEPGATKTGSIPDFQPDAIPDRHNIVL